MKTWETSVETFLKAADWLGEEDQPMVTALREVARKIDEDGVQAALVNQFGVTYRTLMKQKEGGSEEVDPLDALLNE